MKKWTALILALLLVVLPVGCAGAPAVDDIKQGTGTLPQGNETDLGEFPDGSTDLPTDVTDEEQQKPENSTAGTDKEETTTQKPQQTEDEKPEEQTTEPEKEPEKQPDSQPSTPTGNTSGEYRAVWISYLELGGMLTGKTEQQFRSNIAAAFTNVANAGMNTVIVHARPFGDALYNSTIFPTSYLITGTEGDPLPFDPLAIMVTEAHKLGLSIEAWINPYRVRASAGKALAASNPAQQYLNAGSNAVYRYNNGIYYNPGAQEAVNLIVSGIEEIVKGYDVDGIHFDDYFYATTDSSIDSTLYAAYQNGGGSMGMADWRRANVNAMVKQVYAAIKAIDSSVRFGISPQGNTSINYSTLYADVATWVGSSGYVDYICPQIYYGFEHATYAYQNVLNEFNNMIKTDSVTLYVGLAAYKIGNTDNYAGASGKYEWANHSDMLSRMVTASRGAARCKGFVIYSYSSIFTPAAAVQAQVASEMSALTSIL